MRPGHVALTLIVYTNYKPNYKRFTLKAYPAGNQISL